MTNATQLLKDGVSARTQVHSTLLSTRLVACCSEPSAAEAGPVLAS